MIKLKIIAGSNLEALEAIQDLWPDQKITDLKIDNSYKITNEKVYTITIHHADKPA